MSREVVFRPGAQSDLDALYDYVVRDSGLPLAKAFITRIEAICLTLGTLPDRGRLRPEFGEHVRTIALDRRVQIAYRVTVDVVEILGIAYRGLDSVGDPL